MFGVPFRKALLILLFVWTFVFFSGILIFTPYITTVDNASCGVEDTSPIDHFPKELSFILLNWKRLDSLKIIVQHAQVYHEFITEIVIGNNNPNISLRSEDFTSPSIPVRILNFPQNRYFYARYEACMLAKGLYCYMQDDDWDNKHLRSLYANFLRYPHLLHTDTNAFVHYLSWAWTFFDPSINLHTGFSWVGTGAIASKVNVKRFMEEQALLMDREDLPLADMYFSTWFNQVPYQLENELSELESRFGFSSEPGGINRNKLHITKGLKLIYEELRKNKEWGSDFFPEKESHPIVEERYTKSPCFADDCLFMTSVHSFPNPRQIMYDLRYDLEGMEKRHGEAFNHELFIANPYHYAVDESYDTAWMSLQDVREADFFGLDLFLPQEKEDIYLKVKHDYQRELSLDVSYDGAKWSNETCAWQVSTKELNSAFFYHYSLTSNCACTFRFLRFRTLQAYDYPLHVYDISFEDRGFTWDTLRGIKSSRGDSCSSKTLVTIETPGSEPFKALREIGNGEIPVSLVLLNWRRTHNFPYIFQHLSKYPFVNEYIIWNNNNEMILDQLSLFPDGAPPGVSIRIINSPHNLHDYAKYLSCSMAINEYCYFQDDDWLNVYFQSQYTSFLRFPHLFHSMTIPIIYLEHRRWNIYNSNVGLHAGFSWLGVGSFTAKTRVQRFLEQVSLFSLTQNELLQADMFFSYFNNDYPVELATKASALDQSFAWSNSVDQWGIVYKRLQLSSLKVYNHLKKGNQGGIIPTNQPAPPYAERDVRSPCRTDNCLFVTNSYPFPNPSEVSFDPKRSIKEQEGVYNSLNWPSNWFWMFNSYERAVDESLFTSWSAYEVAKAGDYFGLDLLTNKIHNKFTVVLDVDISVFDVSISADARTWTKVDYILDKTWMLAGPLRLYSFTISQKTFRLINFFLRDANEGQILSVYELCEGDLPGELPSFSENLVKNPSFDEANPAHLWSVEFPEQLDFNSLQLENGVALSGTGALMFTSKAGGMSYSATQKVELHQDTPRVVVVSAFSKADYAINMDYPQPGYAMVLDLTFVDGTVEYDAYTFVFNPGSHGWQSKSVHIKPEKNLESVTVKLLFRNHKGTVYFDDVSLQEEL